MFHSQGCHLQCLNFSQSFPKRSPRYRRVTLRILLALKDELHFILQHSFKGLKHVPSKGLYKWWFKEIKHRSVLSWILAKSSIWNSLQRDVFPSHISNTLPDVFHGTNQHISTQHITYADCLFINYLHPDGNNSTNFCSLFSLLEINQTTIREKLMLSFLSPAKL